MLSWTYKFGDSQFTRLSEVVATGEDFVIYDPDLRYTTGTPGNYVVEFSGVHAQSCDEPLPSDVDRAVLKAMWPLDEGVTGSVEDVAKPSNYQVKSVEEVSLISSRPGPHLARRVEGRSGDISMEILVDEKLGVPVAISWSDGGNGRVLEVLEPQGSAAPAAEVEGDLGYCAALFEEEETD